MSYEMEGALCVMVQVEEAFEEPSAASKKEPSAAFKKESSAVSYKEPSAAYKEPSAISRRPSRTLHKASCSLRELTDEQLMVRITRNDQEAFACLLRRHLDSIHGYLTRFTGSPADADDLAQETFLRVWQKAHTFKFGRVKFTTWLHRIAHNLSVDEFRKRHAADDTEVAQLPDERSDQFLHHANHETHAKLTHSIGTLPEAQRCALMLCQVQGFSNQDAAVVLDVSLHALESLLARARRTLKAALFAGSTSKGDANERSR